VGILFTKTKSKIMKNLANIKSLLLQGTVIAMASMLAISCTENKVTDTKTVAEEENVAKLDNRENTAVVARLGDDKQFLIDAAEVNLEEIKLGKLAQEKGTTTEIKDLGKSMQQHHQKSYDELTALAKSKMITIPTQTTDQGNDSFEDLSKETGKDFDKAYADLMVDRHEDAVDLFKTASEDSEDMEIKRWATASLPMMQTHLDRSVKSKEMTKNL
jgi:putative membrane protein